MKTIIKPLILSFIIALAFTACKNDENKVDGPGVLTLDAQNTTETKATLYGKLNAPDPVALDFEFGFEFSTEPLFTEESTTKLRPKYYDENHEFTYQLENLVPDTMYYFRAYMINQMMLYRGETKPISTNSINIGSGEVSEITCCSAKISSCVNTEDEISSYGICYGKTERLNYYSNNHVVGNNRDEDGNFSCLLRTLSCATTYYYCTYVCMNSYYYYGPVSSFMTDDIELSAGQVSNLTCYSAKITATVSKEDEVQSYGIYYSKRSDPTSDGGIRVPGTSKEADGGFSCQLSGLAGSTTYYYCTYARINEGDAGKIGPVNSFTTKEDDVVETGDIDENTLQIKSKLTIGDGAYKTLQMGICYSSTKTVPTIKDQHCEVNEVDADNTFTITLTSIPYDAKEYYRAYVLIDDVVHYGQTKSFELSANINGHSYVNMGLSVLWATCNVGAEKPEDYGEYYAWGETSSKLNVPYSWSSYKWCNGSGTTLTKYNDNGDYGNVDNKMTLEQEDDVAHMKWGGDWRMPTIQEIDELVQNCTWTWTTQNGVNGYLVTSNKMGYTDRSIFLPAAGYREDFGVLVGNGNMGQYWSSSFNSRNPKSSWDLQFNSSDHFSFASDYRPYGQSVRPVCP